MTQERTKNEMARLAFEDGIATITLEMPGKANKIDEHFGATLLEGLEWAKAREGLTGIVIASAHKDFCVGADIDTLYRERDAARMFERVRQLGQLYRAIETCGVPVVAALTGSALGGGYELALACHHRVALDDPAVRIGLPEVTLGVLPGAGGTQRLPRLIGLQPALEIILQGKMLRAPKAKSSGLVDALAPSREAVLEAAKAFIRENPRHATQPWDKKSFRYPGPQPGSDMARQIFMAAAAMLRKKTAGAYRAPELALSAVQEGTPLLFDRALEVEARYFTQLAVGDQAKDMIRTIWYHRTAAEKHEGLPRTDDPKIHKVAILGAGMMGAGIAHISARAGFEVVLKDIDQGALDRGMKHIESELAKARHLSAEEKAAVLGRITPTLEAEPLEGTDLVIEAVIENLEIKHQVTRELEPLLAEGGIWASNTSAIPITDLAKASAHPDRFIGLHFFSPVEKMQLIEIVRGEKTSEETVARCLGYTKAISKLPIVVGDGYGFYTTRVFSAYILEGAQLVAEGFDPVLVEWAARSAGMVVPPLQVFDEVTLKLAVHAFEQGKRYGRLPDVPGVKLVERMVREFDRPGRAAGRGFYDYDDRGKRVGIWPGLRDLADASIPYEKTDLDELRDRLLGLQALEAARAVEAGIIERLRDAEVGAVFGVGFAPNRGGPLGYIDRVGPRRFVERMRDFAERFGPRYTPPKALVEMAERGETYFEPV
ncbi:MAG: 3-hydroxyacyl-CoA dehydrogenase [Deltaproteobacteria bacterium]|nr:MAG: 3-hydroxyacyl-CoA dehydrogenase [Deltaproteobacteria bacterium]